MATFNTPHRLAATAMAITPLLALAPSASAATHTWTGLGADNFWNTAGNWDTPPTFNASADLIFGTGFASGNPHTGGDRTIGSLTINAGVPVTITSFTITLATGSLTRSGAGGTHSIGTAMTLGADGVWDISGGQLNVGTGSSGVGGVGRSLTKNGDGTLSLAATSNTYSGATVVNAGTLVLNGFNNTSGVTINSGRLLINSLNSSVLGPAATSKLTINNTSGTTSLTSANAGPYTLSNEVDLGGDFTFGSAAEVNARLTFNGKTDLKTDVTITLRTASITDANALIRPRFNHADGIGEDGGSYGLAVTSFDSAHLRILRLGGNSTYTGATTISGWTGIDIENTNALPTGTALTLVDANSQLRLANFNQQIGSLSGAGLVNLGSGRLTVGGSASTTFSGLISGTNGQLEVNGGNTLNLTRAAGNTYTGGTTITGGTLLVNNTTGSGTGSGNVTVNSGGTLGGSGIISGTISGNGTVSPGNSPGIVTAGAVNPVDGGDRLNFAFELTAPGGPNYSNPTASINDVLRLTGGSPFSGDTMDAGNVISVYLPAHFNDGSVFRGGFYTDAGNFLASIAAATYDLYIHIDGGSVLFEGMTYELLTDIRPNALLGLSMVNEAGTQFGSIDGWVTQFTITGVPEPASAALLALGGATLLRRQSKVRRMKYEG